VSLFRYRANDSMPLLKCSYAVFSVLMVTVLDCVLYILYIIHTAPYGIFTIHVTEGGLRLGKYVPNGRNRRRNRWPSEFKLIAWFREQIRIRNVNMWPRIYDLLPLRI